MVAIAADGEIETITETVIERVPGGTFMVMAEAHSTGKDHAWHLRHRGIEIGPDAARFLDHAEAHVRREGFKLAELSRLPFAPSICTIEDVAAHVMRGEYYLISEHLVPAACLAIVRHLIPEADRTAMTHVPAEEYLAKLIRHWPSGCDCIMIMSETFWIDSTPRRMCLRRQDNRIVLDALGANGMISKRSTIFAFAKFDRR